MVIDTTLPALPALVASNTTEVQHCREAESDR